MDRIVSALVLLFLASVPSNAQSDAPAAAAPPAAPAAPAAPAQLGTSLQRVYYDVGRNLSLRCDLTKEADENYVWSKNGTDIQSLKEVMDRFDVDGADLKAKGRALEDDFGNYTCAAGGRLRGWEVRGRPHAKLPQNTNVVQEQKVKIQCKVIGKPYPKQVTWLYYNGSEPAVNRSSYLEVASRDGLVLQPNDQGVQGGEIVIERAQPTDAGEYLCLVEDEAHSVNATTTLRVKDMYAALWPFLGICAEVFVLCAIILVYEKRRTKPELDDSDTDNHDQKKS